MRSTTLGAQSNVGVSFDQAEYKGDIVATGALLVDENDGAMRTVVLLAKRLR
jgi:hypothetical protein